MQLTNNLPAIPEEINCPPQQRQSQFRWWIVLPVILGSMTIVTTDPVLFNDLMIRRYEKFYGLVNTSSPSSETACNTEDLQNDSTILELADSVQKSVSRLNIIIAGVGAIPGVLSYIILGANCDRIGRKPLLIIPCIGRILRYSIVLALVQLDLGDIWLIIATVVDGLCGSNSVLLLGAIAYITDCTSEKQRSSAMVLEEATVALTRIFPLLGLGFWLQDHGYTLPVSIDLGISVAMILYVFLIQPESRGENNRSISYLLKQLKRIRLSPVRGTYRVFLIKRRGNDQRKIICLTFIQIMLFIVLFGFVSIHPLYLYGKPLCFNVLDLAILTSAQFSLMIMVSLLLSFWQNRFTNSLYLPFLGILMYSIHLVLFGLAHTVWLLYLAVFIGCLFFVVMAVLRSRLTKLVNDTEFALVFIATGIAETIGSYVVGIVVNAIYGRTLDIYSGIIFFILAGITLIPLGATGYLLYRMLFRRDVKSTAASRSMSIRQSTRDNGLKDDNNSVIRTKF